MNIDFDLGPTLANEKRAMLSDSEDENEEVHKITINEHYAKAFQHRKEREELDKLKAKLGSDISESDIEAEETDSESAESEDEDGEELTPAVDAAILRTLARIKQKDPSIYESGKGIFEEEQEKLAAKAAFTTITRHKTKDPAKPVTLRQVALEAQLNPSRSPSPQPPTHVQEQAALRKETISAFHTAAKADGDDEDDLLVLREKTKDEQEEEGEQYRAFLEHEVGDLREIIGIHEDRAHDGTQSIGKKKKDKKKDREINGVESHSKIRKSKEEQDQEFLMNYILNRGWIDKSKDHIPTYKEITTKPKSKKNKSSQSNADADTPKTDDEEAHLSESSFDSLADTFEVSYNFRFEEPDSSTIPSFPRSIPSLVRREDTKRKDARERRQQRKQEEIEKKKEEVRRMKALKMREIRRKLEVIGREGGIIGRRSAKKEDGKSVHWEGDDGEGKDKGGDVNAALRELDLEGDWDPAKHDQQMAGLFSGGGEDEDDWEDTGEVDEDGKPVWKDDIDIGGISLPGDDEEEVSEIKDKKKKKKKKKGKEDKRDDMGVDIDDVDVDLQAPKQGMDEEDWDGTEEMRKHKLEEYMDEIYNLDFNDMVGDLPTRFTYASVAPQNYSLSPVEILLATDKELNEFMSIKRYAPYKNDAKKWDAKRQVKLRELKASLEERRRNGGWLVSNSSHPDGGTGPGSNGSSRPEEGKPKKRKGKKERMKERAAAEAKGDGVDEGVTAFAGKRNSEMLPLEGEVDSVGANVDEKKAEKKKPQKVSSSFDKESETSKGKNHKRKRDDAEAEIQESNLSLQEKADTDEYESGRQKKKRRRKHKKNGGEGGERVAENADGHVPKE